MMYKTAFLVAAGTIIASLFSSAGAQDAARAPTSNGPQPALTIRGQTLKERLGDKASDEQRVDNCKVPVERRGTKVRPDKCEHEVNPASVDPK
jgi:hypothetical protein